MHRLSAIDALFLYNEELYPSLHQHTLKVSIIGPSIDGEPYSFDGARQVIGDRLHRLPPFRWRVVRVPGDLHHPLAVEDPDFDLEFHVRRMAVPSPGSMRELCELTGEIASRPLDLNKPLWELYLVEGLVGDRVASVAKVHHTLADGVASAELLDLFYDRSPGITDPGADDWKPEEVPSRRKMAARAVPDLARMLVREIPDITRRTRGRRTRSGSEDPGDREGARLAQPFTAPALSFNRAVSPHRSFTLVSRPLADFKVVRGAFGTTINDVVVASAAGGLRRYLERRGELPDRALVGRVPVSTRSPEQRLTWGNHLGVVYVALPVDVPDPIERLRASSASANAAKTDLQATVGTRIENWVEYFPVPLMRAIGRLYDRRLRGGQPSENLIVSNVPGPREPLWIGNAPVESFFSVGPLGQGVGLNMTAWSYVDDMNVCLLADRELIPDLWSLTEDIGAAFDELLDLAAGTGAGSGGGTP